MVPLIRYEGVTKSFGAEQIYSDLNFVIYPGETVCIIGPSGVGKSVMIKMLNGLLPPDSGAIVFDGQPLQHLKSDEAFLKLQTCFHGFPRGSAVRLPRCL